MAKDLRKNQTDAEEIVWELLRNGGFFGLKFRRQHPFSTYIADFYCHSEKIVIEIDGKYHENQEEYDENRDKEMQAKGISVFRFSNDEVFDTENFIKNLEKMLQTNSPSLLGEGARG